MNRNMLWIAVAMIAGLGLLSACESAAAEDIDGWQFYENENYGYSFLFPAECTFGPMPPDCKQKPPEERSAACLCFLNAENPNEVFLQAFLGEAELTLTGFTIAHFETPLYNPPIATDLIEWLQESFKDRLPYIPDEVNSEIDGLPAVRINTPSSPMAISIDEIYLLSDGRLFQIRMTDVDTERNEQFYEQLLSTLQFTD
jgi:hypothetical protein